MTWAKCQNALPPVYPAGTVVKRSITSCPIQRIPIYDGRIIGVRGYHATDRRAAGSELGAQIARIARIRPARARWARTQHAALITSAFAADVDACNAEQSPSQQVWSDQNATSNIAAFFFEI